VQGFTAVAPIAQRQLRPGGCDCLLDGVTARLDRQAGVVAEGAAKQVMEYLGRSLDSSAERGGRLVVTDRARYAMRCVCHAGGPQALVVTWPTGAAYLPVAMFSRGGFDVIIGHISRCPVYADLRQLSLFADRRAVLDVAKSMSWRERPLLRLRSAPYGDSPRVAPHTKVVTQ
jgi:hypothetical protein